MAFKKNLCRIGLAMSGILGCFLLFNIFPWTVFEHPNRTGKVVLGKGSVINLKRAYERWVVEYSSSSPPGPAQQTRLASLPPTSAYARGISPSRFPNGNLINQGRELFFNETFGGNGRTCGTCHPEANNFTIDPKFIATLPDDDPLFVAEFIQELAENFEKPLLMRKAGLILENLNGFDGLANNFNMRSVPHTLTMRTTLAPPMEPPKKLDGTEIPPDDRTG